MIQVKDIFLKISLSIFVLMSISCSNNSDDNDLDPVFSQEYTKLQNLEQISSDIYYYAGIKIGARKASMLIEDSKSCRSYEYFSAMKDSNYKTLDFVFMRFVEGLGCTQTTSAFFMESQLLEKGKLFATIRKGDYYLGLSLGERLYKGALEIGFQGEYLRIEDRMSDYKRIDPNEKVYLYFKKKK